MVRIVGILCGSALAISLLIIALGMPELLPSPTEDPEIAVEPALASDSSEVSETIADATEIENDPLPETAPEPEPALVVAASVETSLEPADDPVNENILKMAVAAEPPPRQSTEHWYAFWSPFSSELAANGFVSQLQRTTGMDYRVVRLKPGVYEVAFAYAAETDIETKLAAISAATGLEMPDG
jgi:hypothetical protein